MKRKHVIMVEMTFDAPVRAKDAKRVLNRVIEGDPVEQVSYEESVRTGASWTHFVLKEGSRVLSALRLKKEGKK